jgi:serine/threonine-protein kinase
VPPLPDEIPSAVRDVVYQLLDKDPARRPGSAGELAATAMDIGSGLNGAQAPTAHRVPPSSPTTAPPTDQLGRLPTVHDVRGTEAATKVSSSPFGAAARAGAGNTVVLPDPARPAQPEPRRRQRRWGPIAAVAGIAALGLALGLWASSGASTVTVPAVGHATAPTAVSIITQAGLRASTHPVDGGQPAGRVVSQSPRPRTRVSAGSTVSLAVASGYIRFSTTGLIGQQYSQAAATLSRLGLRPAQQQTQSNDTAGTVLAATPSGRVKVGTTITLSVAVAPPPPTTVPTPATTVPTPATTPKGKGGGRGNGGDAGSHGGG